MSQDARLLMELEDEVVLSRRSATRGDHETLDYIPGSTLLGWAASHLYERLSVEDAYLVFHSGKVRFYNGLPLTPSGGRARPMPLCWHEDKGGKSAREETREEKGRLISDRVFNLISGKSEHILQPRQLRTGYIDDSGHVFQPSRAYRMKTALNPDTATAAESQLFGYESLDRCQHFVGGISADDDVDPVLFNDLLDVFGGTIRIGRSRSAQYGRVWVSVDRKKMNGETPELSRESRELTLWLISDLALRDTCGSPTLCPDPFILGLPNGQLVLEKTFVRSRSYAPYNAFHKSRGMDRQVLVAGSVLTFMFDEPLPESCLSLLADGIGLYRECGLGEVSINPELIQGEHPKFSTADSTHPIKGLVSSNGVVRPDDPFITFLERRSVGRSTEEVSKAWAQEKLEELKSMYLSARKFNGAKLFDHIGPGRAQWRRVLDAATEPESTQLNKRLFDSDTGVCKEKDADWSIQLDKEKTFRSWLENLILQSDKEKLNTSRNIQWLAKLAEGLRDETCQTSKGRTG